MNTHTQGIANNLALTSCCCCCWSKLLFLNNNPIVTLTIFINHGAGRQLTAASASKWCQVSNGLIFVTVLQFDTSQVYLCV